MGRVQSSDPDVYEHRSGGGCIMIFGLPFLLAGLFVMAIPFLPDAMRKGSPPPWFFAIPFGGLFATVGAALVFGRGGVIIDRRTGLVTKWWGLLVPFSRTHRPLSEFDQVTISREVRRSKNSTYTVYPVRLAGSEGKPIKFEEPRTQATARKTAEELAKFVNVKLVDRSMGTAVVREADELDASLRERKAKKGEQVTVPDEPLGRRSQQEVVGDTLAFEVPPTGFRGQHFVMMALGLIIPTVVYFWFFHAMVGRGGVPGPVQIIVGVLFIGLPFLLFFLGALSSAFTRVRVEVSPRELRVTSRGLLFPRAKAIPTDELEELEIIGAKALEGQSAVAMAGGQAIVARSDATTLAFGAGLSRAELDWMRAVIWNVVTA